MNKTLNLVNLFSKLLVSGLLITACNNNISTLNLKEINNGKEVLLKQSSFTEDNIKNEKKYSFEKNNADEDKYNIDISFGNSTTNSNDINYSKITLSAPKTNINKNEKLTLQAIGFDKFNNEIDYSKDKWVWTISPLLPFKGFITYHENNNTAIFTASDKIGEVNIIARSIKTGQEKSITIKIGL